MREVYIGTKNAVYQKFEVLKTNRNKRYRYGEFLVEGVLQSQGGADLRLGDTLAYLSRRGIVRLGEGIHRVD